MPFTFTPQFKKSCKKQYAGVNLTGNGLPQYNADACDKILLSLESANQHELRFAQEWAQKARAALKNFQADAANLEAYKKFLTDLEEKVRKLFKQQNAKSANGSHKLAGSSYLPKPLQGQSFYESIMHILGYDATTVGASAVFYLMFASLRFMVDSPYWEQVAEYNQAPKEQRFDCKNPTKDQIRANLSEDSTPEQILEAGFLPPPHLGKAYEVEFKSFMEKMGSISKKSDQDKPNQLGHKLTH